MSTSRLQQQVSDDLRNLLPGCTIRENVRPDWLITPEGERLELDFLIEELNAAIEVQGAQHYLYVPFFHGDYSGYLAGFRRDKYKQTICKRAGIALFEVSSPYEIPDVLEILRRQDGRRTSAHYELTIETADEISNYRTRNLRFQVTNRKQAVLNRINSLDRWTNWERTLKECEQEIATSELAIAEWEFRLTTENSPRQQDKITKRINKLRQGILNNRMRIAAYSDPERRTSEIDRYIASIADAQAKMNRAEGQYTTFTHVLRRREERKRVILTVDEVRSHLADDTDDPANRALVIHGLACLEELIDLQNQVRSYQSQIHKLQRQIKHQR